MSIVTYDDLDTPVFELDTMRYLFRDGLQGMWIDFLPDYAFADTDLTTPANPGEGIAGYVDRGPYGYNDTQPVITARPILGRVPVGGRRNLLLYTEDFGNAAWVKYGVGVSVAEDGFTKIYPTVTDVAGRHRVYMGQLLVGTLDTVYISATVRPSGYDACALAYGNNGGFLAGMRFSLSGDGAIGTSQAFAQTAYVADSAYIEKNADDSFEIGAAFRLTESPASMGIEVFALPSVSSSIISFVGNGYDGVEIKRPSFSLTPGPYQKVVSQYDITEAGVPSVYYAHYDGADDVLPSSLTIPSISEGCFILVGTAGIWIDNEYSNTTGTLSVGPNTYTGGPAGILPIVGKVLSIIVRDEPLTDQERQKVIQAGIKRGSPGEIE